MAQLMARVQGHEKQKKLFQHFLQSQHIPHALVFSGPEGIGKFLTALAFAQELLCENFSTQQLKACGFCGSCIRVEKQQSEYLKIVSPTGAQIKIEQIREVLDFLSLSSGGRRRVIIIDQAHTMNAQASNSLLKTLEEPQENVFFILITSDIKLLMPTVRSRSQVVLFQALSLAELKHVTPHLADWMYTASRGRAGLLQSIAKPEFIEKRNYDLQLFMKFWLEDEFLENNLLEDFPKERIAVISLLKNWLYFVKDVIVLKNNLHEQVVYQDQMPNYKELMMISLESWLQFVQALVQSEKDAEKLDLNLMFEALWVKFRRPAFADQDQIKGSLSL